MAREFAGVDPDVEESCLNSLDKMKCDLENGPTWRQKRGAAGCAGNRSNKWWRAATGQISVPVAGRWISVPFARGSVFDDGRRIVTEPVRLSKVTCCRDR